MSDENAHRLDTEIALLDAMFPDQTNFNRKSREFAYSNGAASLLLRLPDEYPASAATPDVILATDARKNDVRDRTRVAVRGLCLVGGEEVLDAIVGAFEQILETAASRHGKPISDAVSDKKQSQEYKTVIIWLHHLLNANKRKLALSPPPAVPAVSGLTKPGYPGVLVFSGPESAVTEHVQVLKAQNWQAIQVRLDQNELWQFAHGGGVKEMESMSEIVRAVEDVDDDRDKGQKQKEELLKAIGIK